MHGDDRGVTAERTRLARMQRLISLFAQAPGFVAVTRGREHVYEIANPAYLELVGREHITGLSVRAALPELDQKFIDKLTQVFDTGEAYIGRRIPVGLKRGTSGEIENRIVDFVFRPIVDDHGRVDGIFIQGTDITDQAMAEREAETERLRLDAVIESLPSGVALANPAGLITRVNAANREIWGMHTMSDDFEAYGERLGWWADDRSGRDAAAPRRLGVGARARASGARRIVEIQPSTNIHGGRCSCRQRRCACPRRTRRRRGCTNDISDRVRARRTCASEARFRTRPTRCRRWCAAQPTETSTSTTAV